MVGVYGCTLRALRVHAFHREPGMERRGGAAGRPREDEEARHPAPIMGARKQPPSKRRRVGVVWDEGNLAKHSAERGAPESSAEEHVFFVDVGLPNSPPAAADAICC